MDTLAAASSAGSRLVWQHSPLLFSSVLMNAMNSPEIASPPIVWSVAGSDSGGGAGLSADARAARAAGVHLCPVVAAVTAQHSRAVLHVQPVPAEVVRAQLAALAADMPPAVIKTGLLGSAAAVREVARCVDALRAAGRRVALVVDPVLGATTGAAFADEQYLCALRDELLPRASLVTPNVREAQRLAGLPPDAPPPALAAALRGMGAQAVAVTGGDVPDAAGSDTRWALDWGDTAHACGWLALPRLAARHTHGSGCTFAASAAAAMARGFVAADALVLAKMATAHALHCGYAAGSGAGPANAQPGSAALPHLMPVMTWGKAPPDAALLQADASPAAPLMEGGGCALYAIVDSAARVQQAAQARIPIIQLRIKASAGGGDAAWHAALRREAQQALAACRAAGATLVIDDHWRLALEMAAAGAAGLALHLGQEDLLALRDAERAQLAASGVRLGVSSHSVWELARARSLRPWYIACGPVWPTTTKAMPWRPQGLRNLRWWSRMAGWPVVAIGGVLEGSQARQCAAAGAAAVCVVRGLGADIAHSTPHWLAAIAAGAASAAGSVAGAGGDGWPHPTL